MDRCHRPFARWPLDSNFGLLLFHVFFLTLFPPHLQMDANGIPYMCILNAHYASIACIPMSWCAMYVAESATMWCRPTFRLSCFHVVCDHGKHVNDVKAKVFEAEPAVAIKQDEKYQTRGCRVSWLLQIFKAKSLRWYILEFFEIKECFLGTCDFCVDLANGPELNHDGFKWVQHPLAVGSFGVQGLHLLHPVEWSCHHLTPFALSTGPWSCNSSWPRRNVSRRLWWW